MHIRSPEFAEGAAIPRKYTCDGQDVSPPLEWGDVPAEAVELLLIVDDPDAPGGVWDHWIIAGLNPRSGGLGEGEVPAGTVQGINGFNSIGYGGPCPPPGHGPHRYYFTLYALASESRLSEGVGAEAARQATTDSVIRMAQTMGRYERAAG